MRRCHKLRSAVMIGESRARACSAHARWRSTGAAAQLFSESSGEACRRRTVDRGSVTGSPVRSCCDRPGFCRARRPPAGCWCCWCPRSAAPRTASASLWRNCKCADNALGGLLGGVRGVCGAVGSCLCISVRVVAVVWLADEHRDAEPAVCGPVEPPQAIVAECTSSSKLKLMQMKKIFSSDADASNQGATAGCSDCSQQCADTHQGSMADHLLVPKIAAHVHNTTDLEQVSKDAIESMYGSVLEKLEAERSQKSRSWQLDLRSISSLKHIFPPPPPPPTKRAHGVSYAAKQHRLWPIAGLRYVVKHWALASPGLPKSAKAMPALHAQLLGAVLDLLDVAALSRHVHKRILQSCAKNTVPAAEQDEAKAGDSISAAKTGARAELGVWELEGKAEIVAWMSSDADGCLAKHTRLREVEVLALQFVMLYLRYCAAAGVAVDSRRILDSSLLPVIEEDLDASIQDMEMPHTRFHTSIALVYTFTFFPDLRVLLDTLDPNWSPPQRLSLAELCHKADQLVATYLSRLRAPSASLASSSPVPVTASAGIENAEMADVQILHAVRELVSAVSACVPRAKAAPEQKVHISAAIADVNRVAWSAKASVVTWAAGTRCSGWREHQQQRYLAAMQDMKLEAVPGLAKTHTYAKAAGAQVPPRRLAKRLMQELIAMQRDLPLSLEEVGKLISLSAPRRHGCERAPAPPNHLLLPWSKGHLK